MADHDRDEELSRRYRELSREGPPRALDEAILAASRREVESRPAPLVAPTGRRRWFVPVAAAAVVVLSAVVTLHVQREQPDAEMSTPQIATAPPVRKDDAPAASPPAQMREEQLAASRAKEAEAPRERVEAAKPQPERRQRQSAPAPAPNPAMPSQPPVGESATAMARSEPKAAAESERFSQDPAPVAAAPPAAATQMRPAAPAAQPAPRAADSAASSGPSASAESRALGGLRDNKMLAKIEMEPPEKILERIASLRREGRAKEADDLYAEFKRRFPRYEIPDAMREQVLPR